VIGGISEMGVEDMFGSKRESDGKTEKMHNKTLVLLSQNV
jgi:hypothetical protein